MRQIIESIPEMSNENLVKLLQNAIRILASPRDARCNDARDVLKAVSNEWSRRTARHEWFPWPTTDSPGGSGRLIPYGWPTEGMLRYLGYHVGEMSPIPKDERKFILDYIFERQLPPLNDPAYYSVWSEPKTSERLYKLANSIAAFARNAKRRDSVALAKAINDWEDDLEYLRKKYYIGYFNFAWPPTELL